MKVEAFLFGLFVMTVVCVAAALLVVTNLSPDDVGIVGIGALLGSLFGALLGFSTLGGYYLRRRFGGRREYADAVGPALRQAAVVATAGVGLLILQGLRVLTVWSAGLFVLLIASGEILVRARRRA